MPSDDRTRHKNEQPVVAGILDYSLLLIFVCFWLGPITYVGLTDRSVASVGDFLNNNYRVACLFTHSVDAWRDYYFQVRVEGRPRWVDVPEHDYSQMEPFGHRTRLHRMLVKSGAQHHGMLQRQRMAEFIKRRYEKLHPDSPPVEAVRFRFVRHEVGEEWVQQRGPWVKPPLASVDAGHALSTHFFDGRAALDRSGDPIGLQPKER